MPTGQPTAIDEVDLRALNRADLGERFRRLMRDENGRPASWSSAVLAGSDLGDLLAEIRRRSYEDMSEGVSPLRLFPV